MRKIKQIFEILVIFSVGLLHLNLMSCGFFDDGIKDTEKKEQISGIRLSSSKLSVQVAGICYLGFSTTPSYSIKPEWKYDSSIIEIEEQSNGIVIKGIAEGECAVTCTYQDRSATAIITVSGFAESYVDTTEPYIYSDTTAMQMGVNDSETIHVSLYNGTAADIDGYTWTIENPAVASINPTGQYCTISSLSQGYSRIKVTHSKAPYPYYIGVYVLEDITKVTFITTKNNIVKLNTNDGEKSISVSLKNPKSENYQKDFTWEITEGEEYLSILSNNENCVLTPLATGTAYIRIKHPEAEYPLDITIRVVEIVENVYIEPSTTRMTLSGNGVNTDTISAKLIGISEGKDYSNDDFSFEVEQEKDSSGIGKYVEYQSFANQITFTGKHNGAAVLYISHPSSAKKRQVLIITENQAADTVDASCMLTTTQNYIKTKVGAEETKLIVSLKGGYEEDNQNFQWSVKQQPKDGKSDVIEIVKADGKVITSRAADLTYTSGTAYIKPCAVGNAVITVTNSKSYYPLEILVNVLDANAVLEEQYYFTGEGIIKFLNCETYDYSVRLRSAPESVKNKITWKSDNPNLLINASGENASLSSKATGSVISHITVDHPSAQSPKEVLVLNADTQEELDAMKAFYSNKTYYSVNVGSEISIFANQVGFTDENGNNLDFSKVASQVQWTSSEPTIASVERSTEDPLTGIVTGKKSGTAKITLSYNSVSASFTVTVYPKDIVIGEIEKTIYLTTTQNVIILGGPGKTASASITAIGLDNSNLSGLLWESKNENVATVIGNGTSATITAECEGEAEIHISHPDSENTLKMHVRVGSEYVEAEKTTIPYITAVNLLKVIIGEEDIKLNANLANYSETDTKGFSFVSGNESIVTLSAQSSNGTAYVHGVSSGSTEITISHTKTDVTKKVLVVAGKTQDEINSILAKSVYMTTTKNVICFSGIEQSENVSISAVNLDEAQYSKITWESADKSIAEVMPNGSSATITSKGTGKTIITASYPGSLNSIEFYIFVGTEYVVHKNIVTYISASTDIIAILKDTPNYKLSAVLVNPEDKNDGLTGFSFSIDDESIARIISQSQNGTCFIEPKNAGQAEIIINHPKSKYPKKILVVIGNTLEELSEFKFLSTVTNVVNIGEGGTRSVTVSLENATETVIGGFKWHSMDPTVASIAQTTSGTALISGNKIGTTKVTVSHEQSKFTLDIIVQVIDPIAAAATPFIQVPNPIINLVESTTWTTMTAELVGGNKSDAAGLIWSIYEGTDIVELYSQNGVAKIRAKKAGNATVRVHHDKAAYDQDIRIICDAKSATEYSIGISSGNIMSIRPDAGDQTITATLVNGSTTDKYNFRWSMDVFDVVDMTYSANTAILTPLKEGTATITVSHPKAAYDQQIVVKVQQYNSFGFSSLSRTVAVGQSTFITMEVPVSSEKTKVTYYSENPKVVDIDGTSAVCQITGRSAETGKVHAQLIAERTGTVLATADMLVIVTPAPENPIYINGTAGLATTFTMTLGTNKILTAEIVGDGISIADQSNLEWSVDTKQDVLKLANSAAGKVAGNSAYLMAEKAGEATLTITHPKTSYSLVYHIIVPGPATVDVTLDKSYVTIEKGKNTTVKATVSSKKSSDYKLLNWTISRPNGQEIATVNGNGQTVTILALKSGTAYLTCSYPGNGSSAECQVTITDPKAFSIEKNVIRLQPNSTKTFEYTVSPSDAEINWVAASNSDGNDIFQPHDNGHDSSGKGTVTVSSFGKVGTGTLSGVSSYGPKASIQVQVSWDYKLTIEGSTNFSITPEQTKILEYTVFPENAEVELVAEDETKSKLFNVDTISGKNGKGKFVITPLAESDGYINLTVKAKNPNDTTDSPNGTIFGKQTVKAQFKYDELTPIVTFEKSDGYYSKYNDGILYIGDGETATFKFDIKEKNTDAFISKVIFARNTGDGEAGSGVVDSLKKSDKKTKTYQFSDAGNELDSYVYKITRLCEPYLHSRRIDYESDEFYWRQYWKCAYYNGNDDGYFCLIYKGSSGGDTNHLIISSTVNTCQRCPKNVLFWAEDNYIGNSVPYRYYVEDRKDPCILNTWGGWERRERTDISDSNPMYMDAKKFEETAWLFTPGTTDMHDDQNLFWDYENQSVLNEKGLKVTNGDNRNVNVNVIPHPVYENVTAIKTTSLDTSPAQSQIGEITVYINHFGKEKQSDKKFIVYYEARKCAKDYKK